MMMSIRSDGEREDKPFGLGAAAGEEVSVVLDVFLGVHGHRQRRGWHLLNSNHRMTGRETQGRKEECKWSREFTRRLGSRGEGYILQQVWQVCADCIGPRSEVTHLRFSIPTDDCRGSSGAHVTEPPASFLGHTIPSETGPLL